MLNMGNYCSNERKLPPCPEIFIDLEKGEGFKDYNIDVKDIEEYRKLNNLSPPFIIKTTLKNNYPKLNEIKD